MVDRHEDIELNALADAHRGGPFVEALSDTASSGRYILTQDIFDVLRDLPAGSGAEIQLADAINIQVHRGNVNAVHSAALCFECGSVDSFLAAISYVANLRHS